MQKTSEAPTYIDKVKVVLFTNVEDIFHKEKTALLSKSVQNRLDTIPGSPSLSAPDKELREGESNQTRLTIQTGSQKRTFLREVRLRKAVEVSNEASRKPQKNRAPFWQSVLEKAQTSNDKQKRTGKTEVSIELGGWINLPYGIHTTLALVVEYFDGDSICSFKVDSCDSKGAVQVLLSGSCDIIADCPVETIKLYCYGIEDKSVWIENLSFECKE